MDLTLRQKQLLLAVCGFIICSSLVLVEAIVYYSTGYDLGKYDGYKLGYNEGNISGFYNVIYTLTCPACICELPIECPHLQCPTTTTITTTVTTSTTTSTTTITCPAFAVPKEISQKHLNLRIPNKPPAVQHGYYLGIQDTWELYQTPNRPKFYPGPSLTGPDYYETLQGDKLQENSFCFVNRGGGFWINRTKDENGRMMWEWNDGQCLSSVMWVHKA